MNEEKRPDNGDNIDAYRSEENEEANLCEADGTKGKKLDIAREMFDWAESFVTALIILAILFAFFVRLVGVQGGSMENTLHGNEFLIVSDLFYKPHAGDIVVMTKKEFMKDSIVKRVIATEGQEVYVDYDRGDVYVDGEKLDEPYTKTPTTRRGDVLFPATVPDGHLFVMGDNRNGSTDSRVSDVGMIDERLVVGHVLFRVFPLNKIGTVR